MNQLAISCHNKVVAENKIKQFQEVLGANNGYFLYNPELKKTGTMNFFMVDYGFESDVDYKTFHKMWKTLTSEVIETRKKTLWQKIVDIIPFRK